MKKLNDTRAYKYLVRCCDHMNGKVVINSRVIKLTGDYMLTTEHTNLGGYLEQCDDIDFFEFSDDSYIAFKHSEVQPGNDIKFLGYGVKGQGRFHRVFTCAA